MTTINAYINFDGTCREAMTFYKECIGGDLVLQTVAGTPMEAQSPAHMKDKILHSSLQKDKLVIMGSDMTYPGFIQGNNVSLSINCSSEEEINTFFTKLSDGGQVMHPLADSFWGARFAVLADKFGTRWMLNYEKQKS
ncbi:MAG: VOC family protein [Sediminibacterium sp.]